MQVRILYVLRLIKTYLQKCISFLHIFDFIYIEFCFFWNYLFFTNFRIYFICHNMDSYQGYALVGSLMFEVCRCFKWRRLVLIHMILFHMISWHHLQVIWSKTFVTCRKFCTMHLPLRMIVALILIWLIAISKLAETLVSVVDIGEAMAYWPT